MVLRLPSFRKLNIVMRLIQFRRRRRSIFSHLTDNNIANKDFRSRKIDSPSSQRIPVRRFGVIRAQIWIITTRDGRVNEDGDKLIPERSDVYEVSIVIRVDLVTSARRGE